MDINELKGFFHVMRGAKNVKSEVEDVVEKRWDPATGNSPEIKVGERFNITFFEENNSGSLIYDATEYSIDPSMLEQKFQEIEGFDGIKFEINAVKGSVFNPSLDMPTEVEKGREFKVSLLYKTIEEIEYASPLNSVEKAQIEKGFQEIMAADNVKVKVEHITEPRWDSVTDTSPVVKAGERHKVVFSYQEDVSSSVTYTTLAFFAYHSPETDLTSYQEDGLWFIEVDLGSLVSKAGKELVGSVVDSPEETKEFYELLLDRYEEGRGAFASFIKEAYNGPSEDLEIDCFLIRGFNESKVRYSFHEKDTERNHFLNAVRGVLNREIEAFNEPRSEKIEGIYDPDDWYGRFKWKQKNFSSHDVGKIKARDLDKIRVVSSDSKIPEKPQWLSNILHFGQHRAAVKEFIVNENAARKEVRSTDVYRSARSFIAYENLVEPLDIPIQHFFENGFISTILAEDSRGALVAEVQERYAIKSGSAREATRYARGFVQSYEEAKANGEELPGSDASPFRIQ